MRNCSSTLWATVATLALTGTLLVPISVAQATETASPKLTPRVRIPTTPPKIENGSRIRTEIPVPEEELKDAEDDRVKAESAEAEPKVRARVGTPRIESSTPVTVETNPRIRTRIATPDQDEAPTEATKPRRVRIGAPPVDEAKPVAAENAPYNRKRIAVPVDDNTTQDEAPQGRRRQGSRDQSESQPVDSGNAGSTRQADIPYNRRRIETGSADINVARDYVGKVPGDAVILRPGSFQQILSKLPVTRKLDVNVLATNPIVTLSGTTFDLDPMLSNPKSLHNVAKRLKALPQLVEVMPANVAISEINQRGLAVQSVLNYRLKIGACTSAANRTLLVNAGISCFTFKSLPAREADFSNPASIEFVKNAGDRAKAVANARVQSEANAADIKQNIANFRAILNDPQQRAQVEETIGAAETARLETLDDDTLAGELVNYHDVVVTEVAFIPIMGVIPPSNAWFNQWQKAKADAYLKKLAAAETQLAGATKATSYPIGDFNFLAGFTLGSKHEWRQGVSTTIKWCVFGCEKTYFAEAWAGFHYGFGLRFPMKFSGTYNFDPADKGKASLASTLTMFDGNAEDYRSTGLPEDKIFSGQELVAEFGANAGIHANLPLIGGIGPIQFDPTIKLTDMLPAPFAGGNMTPPMPASSGMQGEPTEAKFVLDQVDLLGERANLGIVSAKVHPAVYIGVVSNGMSLTVTGENPADGFQSVALTGGKETTQLPIGAGQFSSFSVGAPKYNIGFTLTPGLTARLSLNLAVWGTSVDWDVRFPAAQITVPSEGINFACHEGTICTRNFSLSPDGPVTAFKKDLKKWGLDFDAYWLPKCLDEICETSVKLKRYDVLEAAYAQEATLGSTWGVVTGIHKAPMQGNLAVADTAAEKYVAESKVRKAQKSSDTSAAMGMFAQAIYTKQCKDSICVDNVAVIAAQMGPRAKQIATAAPYQDEAVTNKQVNKEFGPKFVAEIDASKIRYDMNRAKSVKTQVDQMGGKQPSLPTTRCRTARCVTPN